MIYHLVESIREVLKDTFREGLRRRCTNEQLERVQELHEELLAELERGDPQKAGHVMAMHFDETVMTMIQDNLASENA